MTGLVVGELTVLRFSHRDSRGANIRWWCRCSCGNEIPVLGVNLRSGRSQRCNECRLNALPSGESQRRHLFRKYANGADRRLLWWELSYEQFCTLIDSPCHYCGDAPKRIQRHSNYRGSYVCNGIDRKNNEKGYTLRNCLPGCKTCNLAKGDLPYREFLRWLDDVTHHRCRDSTT
jgi:hypothetical protein